MKVVPSCTWAECTDPATIPQVDKTGAVWATLCPLHDKLLTQASSDPNMYSKVKETAGKNSSEGKSSEEIEISRILDALVNGGRVRRR
jgi:hypothetical protein